MKIRSRLKLVKLCLLMLCVAAVAVYCFSTQRVSANSFGPPPSQTGAPGEGTCVSCHFSFPLNSGGGTLTITGLPASYSPGQEVNVTITLTQTNRVLYGFQVTALDDAGRQAGSFMITDPARTQTVTGVVGGVRTYVEHTVTGTNPSATNQGSWTFKWSAPAAGVGRVTFYAAGNAANGDGFNSEDFIYTTTAVTQPAQTGPAITGLNPNAVAASGPGFTVIVTGSNFVNGSIVRWNNADRTTSFISSTQLSASIPAADIAVAGTAAITVVNPASAPSNSLTFTIAGSGVEADVAPRGNTNGAVTISDWVQVGRFAAGLDVVSQGSEFQRADCAPKDSSGNGLISISDWVQAGRYAAGLDPVAPASGPTSAVSATAVASSNEHGVSSVDAETAQKRTMRVVRSATGYDRTSSLIIQLDAQGGENALGFSLNYDPNQLRFAGAELPSELSHATFIVNTEQAENGRIGVLLLLPPGRKLPAGDWSLMAINFRALGDQSLSDAQVSFGDEPVAREVADVNAHSLRVTFEEAAASPNISTVDPCYADTRGSKVRFRCYRKGSS